MKSILEELGDLHEAVDSEVPKRNLLSLITRIRNRYIEENIDAKIQALETYFHTDINDTIKLKIATSGVVASGVKPHENQK